MVPAVLVYVIGPTRAFSHFDEGCLPAALLDAPITRGNEPYMSIGVRCQKGKKQNGKQEIKDQKESWNARSEILYLLDARRCRRKTL